MEAFVSIRRHPTLFLLILIILQPSSRPPSDHQTIALLSFFKNTKTKQPKKRGFARLWASLTMVWLE
jgi:hypothetical protein